jgi:hypothetical protein
MLSLFFVVAREKSVGLGFLKIRVLKKKQLLKAFEVKFKPF